MLSVKNVTATISGKPILKGLNLEIGHGEIHAIMGPNGAGKSTLAKILAGDPTYEVTGGSVTFMGQDLLELEPEERAALGLFLSFQNPPEIAGVPTDLFLHQALNAVRKEPLDAQAFEKLLQTKMDAVKMREEFKKRDINEGFSGGEKKRSEILQMALLEPKLAILDEIDSGLDIDAMRTVADGINQLRSKERSLLVITHYQRLLDYIKPDYVHVISDGKIIHSGDATLAHKLEAEGYDWLLQSESTS